MSGASVTVGWGLAAALVLLVGVAVTVSLVGRFGISRTLVIAAARAVVQLALVASVIVAVVRSWWLTAAFVLVMLAVASWTSARRMTPSRSGVLAAVAITAGVVPVLAVTLLSGAVPLTGISVVPVAGIVIGGAMTATSQGGRRALDDLDAHRDQYEAGLALGGRRRDAAMLVCRPAATQALVPPMDQTRTVGLVTLPGAFVGVLIGSGNPVQAAAAQVLVLIGLLAAESVAVAVVLELVARGAITRAPARSASAG
ncbi:ABC transporter permease [Actinomycetospora sp. TBRC 11914]|uniref:ABC transporter permease n=1 Tax=Actinomycetospora sp. TBRC 11914 TaxID=2729387 RepID=UPI00145CAA51|nr:ABC transporter permease [Actinomycetospora sp. TBRC 11914]NMO92753.1 ABC transporter permease [Actinomycetospora sp. TBRC 11914]